MLKIDLSPHAKIHWENDIKALRVEWLSLFMSLDEFKKIVEQALGALKENSGSIWIADSYNSDGVFSKDIQEYMQQDDVTSFAKMAGLSMVLTVMPKSAGLSSMSTKKWTKEAEKKGVYTMAEFPDLASCRSWVKENS